MISRRKFFELSAVSAVYLSASAKGLANMPLPVNGNIRLGGPLFREINNDPIEWVKAHKEWGYSAAYCPVESDASDEITNAFKEEANKSNLIIAEVGAWSNPISPDDKQRNEAIEYCIRQLALAEKLRANCCVNIAGSRNPDKWDGPHKDNLTQETFDLIVETTQQIIDAVKPKRTYFALETMPYVFPNSIESYERILKKIDRKRFAVHFDPVNLINSVDKYYNNGAIIKEAFKRLGKYVKSCHGKDSILQDNLTVHINETQPGLGNLDYKTYLTELSKLDNVPLMLEHMEKPEGYRAAIEYVKKIANNANLKIYKL